jgi:4-hydroxymandelate oxidase
MYAIPSHLCSLADYEKEAALCLDDKAWAYISGAAMDGLTTQRNRDQLDQLLVRQRILTQGLGSGSSEQRLFGQKLSMPLLVAPLAYQKLAHPHGEVATAQAAAAQGVGFCLSTLASSSIEEVQQVPSTAPRWFQLYCQKDPTLNMELIKRTEHAGFSAIVITVDAPINGVRNTEQRVKFALPEGVRAVNLPSLPKAEAGDSVFSQWMGQAPTWETIAQVKSATSLPIVLKGVMDPEDARLAVEHGVDALVVSNHGGRVLDSQPSSIEVLPRIKEVLPSDMPVLLDSGIRRGSDLFKAIALGADAVLLGRPIFYALAVAGPLGVAHILRILRDELEATMALCGCASIKDISERCLYQP